MKVSYRWLQDYTSIPWSPQELAEKLTMVGIEVEGIESLAPDISKVYVGKIIQAEPHPQANLKVCQIDIGSEVLTIVCGAPNARVGIKVPVAVVGAILPGGVEIKPVSIRGVMSYGMACSERELGLGDDHSGVMELPEDTPLGVELVTAMGLDDQILDVSIYANRPDCMSMLGIAREVAALAQTKINYPQIEIKENAEQIHDYTSVQIEAPDKCPRYSVRIIRGVQIKESPLWMQQRLRAAGMRPINNIVDITNYVMLETGQPLHAFDYDKLTEHRIVVREPRPEEKTFVTLDGIERRLDTDMLMICDAAGPVCIGGVMGGENSEVTETTTTILLESANFTAANIRRTARKLAIGSEAAARFEKGIDPSGTILALNRAAQLMVELAGGEVVAGIIDVNYVDTNPRTISLWPQHVNKLLGTEIDEATMISILSSLELNVDHSTLPWKVVVPGFRRDLELECDLIEEIARFWGYDQIPITLPQAASGAGGESLELEQVDQLKQQLVGAGMQEIMTYSFVNRQSLAKSSLAQSETLSQVIELANPLTEDLAVMRTTLMPSMLACAAHNIKRQQEQLRLFEISKVYLPKQLPLTELPNEERHLGLLLYGQRIDKHWSMPTVPFDLYDLKGLIELVLENFDADFHWQIGSMAIFHPGRQGQVTIGDEVVAVFGEVHPNVQLEYDIPNRIYLAEVYLDKLFQYQKPVPRFQSLPRFPGVDRDMAILIAEDTPVGDVIAELRQAGGELLKSISLFDVYSGQQIETGKKSVAFSFVFQGDRTLTDQEVNEQLEKMYTAVRLKFNAIRR